MKSQAQEAALVLAQLKRWRDEVRALIDEAHDGVTAELLQRRLTKLKEEIRAAAKYETLSGKKQEKSKIECAYFGPCVRSTIANFRLRTDTSPKSPAWSKNLSTVELELEYVVHEMTKEGW